MADQDSFNNVIRDPSRSFNDCGRYLYKKKNYKEMCKRYNRVLLICGEGPTTLKLKSVVCTIFDADDKHQFTVYIKNLQKFNVITLKFRVILLFFKLYIL